VLKSRHGLEIRGAVGADALGLATLLAEAGHEVAVHDLAERLEAIRNGPGTALIALEWGPPSGVVTAHWHQTLHSARPTAQITMLLVGAGERRRGIGRLLVEAAAQAARSAGCGALELALPTEVASLRAFARALGFVEAGSRSVRALRKRR